LRYSIIDFLALACYSYAFASPFLGPISSLSYVLDATLLTFLLPGWYLVRLCASRGLLRSPIEAGLGLALIPSMGISFTILIEALSILVRFHVGIIGLSIGTIGLQAISTFTNRGFTISLSKPTRLSSILFAMIVMIPILQFVVLPIITYPPSPFPFAQGWDVFTYMMIAGRIQSGSLTSPVTTINPITQQLPIPTGLPLLSALLMPAGIAHPDSVIALIKYGPIIPSLLGLGWTFLICKLTTGKNYIALTGSLIAYSFAGYNVIDTQFFLPASFSWTYSLMAVYAAVMSGKPYHKLVFFSLAVVTAIFFHFYTGIAATFITSLGLLATNLAKLKLPNILNRIAELYPIWGSGAILGINLLGLSVNIPGAGTVIGGIGLISDKVILMLRSLSPAFWITAIVFAIYTLAYRHNLKISFLHFLLIGLLLYFLPISGMFRLLLWPAIFAAVAMAKITSEIGYSLSKRVSPNRPRTPIMLTGFLVLLVLVSAAYPSLVPGTYTSASSINVGSLGTVQSTYSLTEYNAAAFVSAHPPSSNYIILSDPGFALVLGGLTGQEAVRLTQLSNMMPFQQLLQAVENGPFNVTIANRLEGLLGQYYSLANYNGVLIALSARTYYWIKNYGIITWQPMSSSFVDGNTRSNFIDSPIVAHVYGSQDVDLFYLILH